MGILILVFALLVGCSRNFESPYLPSSPEYIGAQWSIDSNGDGVADSVHKYAPGCQATSENCLFQARDQAEKPVVQPVVKPVISPVVQPVVQPTIPEPTQPLEIVMVESIVAANLRMTVGETQNAQVSLLPANVTSPNYSLSSQNSSVAIVRPSGIFAVGEGNTTITAHALDGSDKIGQFQVTVVSGENKEKDDD